MPGPISNEEFYDQVSRDYDRFYGLPRDYTLTQASWLARNCESGPVLDLGCGTGRMLEPLRRAGFTPVGLDCSRRMIGLARKMHPRASLVRAEATRGLPFSEASFKLVVCLHSTLIHVGDMDQIRLVCREAHRVLETGGAFVVELPHPCAYMSPEAKHKWRHLKPGLSYRFVDKMLMEMKAERVGGVSTIVRLIGFEELRKVFEAFSILEVYSGFAGGRFRRDKGDTMVVCARK